MLVLECCPTQTIELFLSGNIPADLVNSYLKQHAPSMQATYLELMLAMNENAISGNLQNEMVKEYFHLMFLLFIGKVGSGTKCLGFDTHRRENEEDENKMKERRKTCFFALEVANRERERKMEKPKTPTTWE